MKPQREHATNNAQTYMVTSTTWERRSLFQAEPWAKLLIDTNYHYRASAYLLHEFVIMPDHFHVLISPQTSLENSVQKGFQDHRLRDAQDYAIHRTYIRQNPVRKSLSEEASTYPWSPAQSRFELDDVPQGLKPDLAGAIGASEAAPFQSALVSSDKSSGK